MCFDINFRKSKRFAFLLYFWYPGMLDGQFLRFDNTIWTLWHSKCENLSFGSLTDWKMLNGIRIRDLAKFSDFSISHSPLKWVECGKIIIFDRFDFGRMWTFSLPGENSTSGYIFTFGSLQRGEGGMVFTFVPFTWGECGINPHSSTTNGRTWILI